MCEMHHSIIIQRHKSYLEHINGSLDILTIIILKCMSLLSSVALVRSILDIYCLNSSWG